MLFITILQIIAKITCSASIERTSLPEIPAEDIVQLPFLKLGSIREILMVGTGTSICNPEIRCLADPNSTCIPCLDSMGLYHRDDATYKLHGGPPRGMTSR